MLKIAGIEKRRIGECLACMRAGRAFDECARSVGVEVDGEYFGMAEGGIPLLGRLYREEAVLERCEVMGKDGNQGVATVLQVCCYNNI